MKILILTLSFFLFSFLQPEKKNSERVYFNHNSTEVLEKNPINPKLKSKDALSRFVEKVKAGEGSLILRGCANYDEQNVSELVSKRLEVVKLSLVDLGVSATNIITEYPNKKTDMTAKSKNVIDTTKTEVTKEFLKAQNRFVEIKFLKRN